jgi:hypothetical protein
MRVPSLKVFFLSISQYVAIKAFHYVFVLRVIVQTERIYFLKEEKENLLIEYTCTLTCTHTCTHTYIYMYH